MVFQFREDMFQAHYLSPPEVEYIYRGIKLIDTFLRTMTLTFEFLVYVGEIYFLVCKTSLLSTSCSLAYINNMTVVPKIQFTFLLKH